MKVLIYKVNTMYCIVIIMLFINLTAAFSDYSFSGNGKSYVIVETKLAWTSAASDAAQKGGYLVHINSLQEQNLIWDAIVNGAKISTSYTTVMDGGGIAYIWIGANDLSTEGTWIWDGSNSGSGTNFWKGQGSAGKNDGQVINSSYNNWGGTSQYGTPKEPDDYGNNQDAAGIALEPWPKNNGSLGKAGEWNDISATNSLYYIIEYDYSAKPSTPTKPTGSNSVCQGTSTTDYATTSTEQAQKYKWEVTPTTAGSFTGESTSAQLFWNKNFSGNAEITVIAVNPLGESASSEKLTVTVKPKPVMNEKPVGSVQLCQNPENSTYTINGTDLATSYVWKIKPITAGQITGNSKSISINWDDGFVGDAYIYVYGVNECGEGTNSDSLLVKVARKPFKPTKPQGKTQLFNNDNNTEYSVEPIDNASQFAWTIEPSSAGSIAINLNKVVINWDDYFYGDVTIKVLAENQCGASDYSDELKVFVSNKPGIPTKPQGKTEICQGENFSDYSTEKTVGAKSYTWKLFPQDAGNVNSDQAKASIAWNKNFSGKVKVFVAAIGEYTTGDNSDTLEVTVKPKPGKGAIPVGNTNLCKNQKNITYNTNNLNNVTSYSWSISPKEAGEIKGNTNSAQVNLNDNFIGSFEISVYGVNDCGNGEESPKLIVKVNKEPDIPTIPTGKNIATKGSQNQEYKTISVEGATSYSWKIEPKEAGSLTNESNICNINWSKTYIGKAQLSVNASNDCGNSNYSDVLEIEVKDSVVSVSDFESIGVSFYPNPVTDILYFSSNQQIINRIEIFDLNGKLQLTLNYPQESINIKELENGIFFIRVYFESGKYFISKFTKKGS